MLGVFFASAAEFAKFELFLGVYFISARHVVLAFTDSTNERKYESLFFFCHNGKVIRDT